MGRTLQKSTLDNGVRIITKRMAHVRSVSMGVWVNVGARDESATENGLSHMIEHMIFKGTRKRSAYRIAKEFDAIGGQTNAFTSFENTCYHAKVMDSHLENMVEILTDIFLNSVFEEDEIEKERPVIFQEISMVEDNPEEYIHVLSSRSYWGDNPLGRSILGTRENLLGFDSKRVKTFFKRFYQPGHIVVSVAGNINHDQILDLLAPSFARIKTRRPFPERTTPAGCPQVQMQNRDLEQVHVCLGAQGISIKDDRRYSFSLLNTVFGGNMSSRLFQKIREDRGLAYSVYSFVSSFEDTGMFGAYAGLTPENVDEAVTLMIQEMRNLKMDRLAASELEDAKNYTKGNLLLAAESVDNQMVRLAQNEINFGRQIAVKEVLHAIEAVTQDDIIELARALFSSDRLALTTLGPLTDKTPFEKMLYHG
jgi:predicted Zn-dependent peptidase